MSTVGFTGTRQGMTAAQRITVKEILMKEQPSMARHGDCIGADAEFHKICLDIFVRVLLHPCNLVAQRAFCKGALTEYPTKPPLDRNRDIVNNSDFMIATPGEYNEVLRSGTWATIRYANSARKRLYLITPDGKIERR